MKNLYQLLDEIEESQSPAMYMGKKSITYLRTFIEGCRFALDANDIEVESPPFHHFSDWVAKKHGYQNSPRGWDMTILNEVNDEVKAVDEFFRFLKDFRRRTPVEKKQIILNEQHKPTGISMYIVNGKTALPPTPKLMKIIQYSGDKGVYLVYHYASRLRYNDQAHKTAKEAMGWAYKEFGVRPEEWTDL